MWCCAWVVAAWYWVAVSARCDVTFANRSYSEEILVSGVWYPRGLAVDYSTHTVYFSYNNESWFNGKVDLNSHAFTAIKELSGRCWFTVDQVRRKVHAGCSNYRGKAGGLFDLDSIAGRFKPAGETGRSVYTVYYYNDTLYYSLYDDDFVHTFVNGHSGLTSALPSNITDLVFDARGDFIFYNDTGVYRGRAGQAGQTQYVGFTTWVYALAVDSRGAAYTCDIGFPRGIWLLDHRAPTATRLLDVQCHGLTFDADGNVIYGDDVRKSIVRLVKC